MNTDRLIFISITIVTVIILAVILITSLKTSVSLNPQTFLDSASNYKGPENAKLTLVEFSDYECPFCAQIFPDLENLQQRYGADLRLSYIHFPLPQHKAAIPAAKAAEAAAKQNKFWEYSKELFLNQPNFSDTDLEKYARTVGLDVEKFKQDKDSKEIEDKVINNRSFGEKLKVSSTPSFYMIYDGKVQSVRLSRSDDIENAVKSVLGEVKSEISGSEEQVNKVYDELKSKYKNTIVGEEVVPIKMALKELLTANPDINSSEIILESINSKDWPDASLGCGKPDQIAAQVITQGYEIKLKTKDKEFNYHTDKVSRAVSC